MGDWKSINIPSVSIDGGNVAHIMPIQDLVQHNAEPGCVCGPWVEKTVDGWLFTHHSLDGREICD